MKLFLMAFKNIMRSKRRAIMTISVLSLGIAIFVFYGTLMDGFNNMSIEGTINEDTSHVRIRKNNFDEDFPYSDENLFKIDTNILNDIDGISYTPSIRLNAEVDNYEDTISAILMGIDYETSKDVFDISSTSEEPIADKAWLALSIANDMGVNVGDYINITFRNKEGSFISAEYEIGGLLNSSNPLFSEQSVMIDVNELQNMLSTDTVSHYSIKVDDKSKIKDITSYIENAYPNDDVMGLDELTKDLNNMMKAKNNMMLPFYLIIVLITFLGLANSILISVWEKRKNMGTLRALGFYDKEIVMMFIYEGLCIGLIGSIIGVLIGVLINIPMSTVGINYAELASTGSGEAAYQANFYIPPIMKSTWNIVYFVGPLIVIPIVSMLISYIPARKSIKMTIVDCIRNKD